MEQQMKERVRRHLEERGCRVVAEDYALERWGKIDFVVRDGPILAFVVVREPRRTRITRKEFEGLARVAADFLGKQGWWHFVCRFDVAVVSGDPPAVELKKDVG